MKFNIGRIRDLVPLLKLLELGLRNLTFSENFNSNTVILTLSAGETQTVSHDLKVTPSQYIIGRKSAPGDIIDGPTWDETNVSFTNSGINTITLTIVIME